MNATETETILPLGDRVLVRPQPAEAQTPGGVFLPDGAQDGPERGTVEAVGPGDMLECGVRGAMVLKAGDVVLFGGHALRHEIKVGGEVLYLMREREVLAVVRS